MNSRERVLSAIRHEQPDKVPVDLGATPSSGISAIAYARLRDRLAVGEGHVRVYDVVQQLAQPEAWALDRFGVDVVDLGRTFNVEDSDWYDTTLPTGHAAQYPTWFRPEKETDESRTAYKNGTAVGRMPAGGTFFDQTYFPWVDGWPNSFAGLDDGMSKVIWSALVHSPWDSADRPDFWPLLKKRAEALRASSDRAIMVVVGCNLFEWGTFIRRIDNFLMDLILEPDSVEKLLDALLERHLKTLENVCSYLGDLVDIVRFGDDLGTDSGPFMSPDLYRTLFKPRHKALCAYVHEHSSAHTFLHSCGSIYRLMPDLIDAGFEIINPVQTNAKDMEPERLKREFGSDITFWGGGIDTRTTLNNGTPADVRKQVLERLEVFSRDGGFVFNTVHNILPDVPPENIIAMFSAVGEFNGE
ncbi:MAG TPA: uroporphyrinogen decarboxylase family protein [Spirochaetia bacterium]|nr:uroporphyrinogen decarboxylase family protein [Spirochaetia bacterium]